MAGSEMCVSAEISRLEFAFPYTGVSPHCRPKLSRYPSQSFHDKYTYLQQGDTSGRSPERRIW